MSRLRGTTAEAGGAGGQGRRTVDRRVCAITISDADQWFEALRLTSRETEIAGKILKEIRDRLGFMENVGLGYLNLSRTAATLSGGESQRIHLATQIGSKLTGVLYVLDEPSIGLHQRDNRKLIDTLLSMRDLGNTVLVVEHDQETIQAADHVIDLGPGAGVHGGEIVAQGSARGDRALSVARSPGNTFRASARSRFRCYAGRAPRRRSSCGEPASTTSRTWTCDFRSAS